MFHELEAETADKLWLKAAEWFKPAGVSIKQSSRCGNTTEVLHAALTLMDPRQRWITSRAPAMNPAFALVEVIWIMNGRNDSAMLNYFNPKLPQFAGTGSTYHGAYGFRLRKHFGVDQLERAYSALSQDKNSRQIVLQIWDSAVDFPELDGGVRSEDIPCNVSSLLKLRDGHLEWTQIMRSNDFILGLPHNVVQFSSLQEILAGWLGVEIGTYHHFADSLHFYDRDAPLSARIDSSPLPFNTDSIALPKDKSDLSFSNLAELADAIASPENNADEVMRVFKQVQLSSPLLSWAAIIAADGLRRRGAAHLMEIAMSNCSNNCLSTMFERWLHRKHPSKGATQ